MWDGVARTAAGPLQCQVRAARDQRRNARSQEGSLIPVRFLRRVRPATPLLPIIALPGSEIAPPLALQIRRCSLGCNGSLLGQTCHARLWPAGPLMTRSGHQVGFSPDGFGADVHDA